jgi:hypothetical protein
MSRLSEVRQCRTPFWGRVGGAIAVKLIQWYDGIQQTQSVGLTLINSAAASSARVR